MIELFPGGCAVEWIYVRTKEHLAKYPSDLDQDMTDVRARLDRYTDSPSPGNARLLEKSTEDFVQRSLKAFDLDWSDLRKEFQTNDSQLADIARLFAEDDTPPTRALILLRVWRMIVELSKLTIHEPSEQIDRSA
jgi:hypothetical protein